MKKINEVYSRTERPIKIVQFGEGNFLRGFVDYIVDVSNEKGTFNGDVAIVKARQGSLDKFRAQDHLFTVSLRGIKNGKLHVENRVITCVQKVVEAYEAYDEFMKLATIDSLEFVISNTTEAGIVYDADDTFAALPPKTFPAKLTKFLYTRFTAFDGDKAKALTILPLELIEGNGKKLKQCILAYCTLWNLSAKFKAWIENDTIFCDTLVDRIITGYPKDEAAELQEKFGYEDPLLVAGEPFGLWVIEAPKEVEARLPFNGPELSVVFTDNLKQYRDSKVRILNGAHTSMVLGAYLAGKDYVAECMKDQVLRKYIETTVMQEVVPTVSLPEKEAVQFAKFVFERFENPFVKHALLSISLNSVSKWKARVLPTLHDIYQRDTVLPTLLTFSFAALTAFYRTDEMQDGCLVGYRDGEPYKISDDEAVLAFFKENSKKTNAELVALLAANIEFWGVDLTQYHGFVDMVSQYLDEIKNKGMKATIENLLA